MKMTVGEKIRKIRKRHNISAKKLASMIGVSDTYMSAYENGKRNPKEETLDKIADALGVHPDALKDNEYDSISAMHKLFSIFRMYDGVIKTSDSIKEEFEKGEFDPTDDDAKVYVSFKSLSAFMFSWYMKYEEMQERLNILENERNVPNRLKKEQEIIDEFDWWMDLYPTSEPDKEMLLTELTRDKRMNNIDRYFRDCNEDKK